MRNRLSGRDLFIALAILTFTLGLRSVMREFFVSTEVGATVAVGLAIIAGFLFIAFIDWALWKDDKKERARLNKELRRWELATGEVLGRASVKRSARWWWQPLQWWWLDRRYKHQ